MTRTDNDTWDLASSVGATATMVAAARAAASRAERPLIDDPFAEPLVRAVGIEALTRMAAEDPPPDDAGSEAVTRMKNMADHMAIRTAFFDEFFLDATAAGITQAVILASGLDSRAYRLAWPAGTVVFEIDQPDVIEFKTRTLAGLGALPTAVRRAVAIDLRDDWPAALRQAGFDPAKPTAWAAEGLLPYLPADAQDSLLDTVTALSASGSRFATESSSSLDLIDEESIRERMQNLGERWRRVGFDLDLSELVYFGDRKEAATYLADHGWQISGSAVRDLFDAHGLTLDAEDAAAFANHRYISGTLGGAR
jgi:methyltransferase (TIGR00027 family)